MISWNLHSISHTGCTVLIGIQWQQWPAVFERVVVMWCSDWTTPGVQFFLWSSYCLTMLVPIFFFQLVSSDFLKILSHKYLSINYLFCLNKSDLVSAA